MQLSQILKDFHILLSPTIRGRYQNVKSKKPVHYDMAVIRWAIWIYAILCNQTIKTFSETKKIIIH